MGDPASSSASRQNAQDALESLPASRQFLQSVLDAQTAHIAILADDGAGFDPLGQPERGMGLTGMRERMEAIGGTLLVESAPRAGARVIAEVGR